jgi:hypothetical protein
MEETKNDIKNLVHELKEYFNLRTKLAELQIKKNAAELIAKIASSLITVVCLSMAFLFASLALALYLSDLMGSYSIGFMMVAGIYILLATIFSLAKNSIKNKISDGIITELFKENDHE